MKTSLLVAALAMVAVACSQGARVSALPHYDAATLAMKYQAVYDLVQNESCTDSSVCSSIGIGSKPCGGVWRYLVYSTATVNQQELNQAVADLNAYEAGYDAQQHIVSDCSVARAAQPACVNNECPDLNAVQ